MDTDEQARRYHRWQFRLSVAGVLLAGGYLSALTFTGAAVGLRDLVSTLTSRWWLQLALALIGLGAVYRLITLPLTWLSGFWLPSRFGLLRQGLGAWLWDAAKATMVGGVLALAGAEAVYALMHASPWWWLWSAGVFLAGYAVLALVAPVWLHPMFYRLVPLEEGELRDRLLRLAARTGVPVLGVWVADQSRKSRTANAAVTGLARTRRIVLFDTLLSEFTPEQVETVLAHELAHHVHRDIPRGLLVQGAISLGTFWVADHALRAGARALGLNGPADVAGLPLLGLVLLTTGLLALPLANGWSRHVERQADDFAVRMTGNPEAFIGAMDRLGTLNLAERDPHVVKEFLLYSHPSIARRVALARARARSSG